MRLKDARELACSVAILRWPGLSRAIDWKAVMMGRVTRWQLERRAVAE